ncbi:hypothetical protein [Hymenobacter actinosclerus]|uniref:Uncharacterized protein n=1 Tax=Hymenobacter actinosclerus TaxID=82805 RepID=A0A1I0ILD1_9BACT|nr:hypothetical protein [Hymenobacter actinosclerus]SET97870.1 hypothetical protein SAMN04487998_3371 [Hymenobacter actinosclerus]
MLTGIVVNYNGTYGLIRANTGILYSFTVRQIKTSGAWRPAPQEAVIIKVQGKQHGVVRSVMKLPPGHLKSTLPSRMIPARFVGWGMAVSRFAPTIKLNSQLQAQHQVKPGSIILVRYEVKSDTNTLVNATELLVVPPNSEHCRSLATTLLADPAEMELGKKTLRKRLNDLGPVTTDEHYHYLRGLLQQWDAYSIEPLDLRFTFTPQQASLLAADGYAHYLSQEALVQLVGQATDPVSLRNAAYQLPAEDLARLARQRVTSLTSETPLVEYQTLGQWLKALPEHVRTEPLLQPLALSQLPLPEQARVSWWEQGLVPMPPLSFLTGELHRRLQLLVADPQQEQPLHQLLAACQHHACLEQTGRELLSALSVSERLSILRVVKPLVDNTTVTNWAAEFIIGQLAGDDLAAAWQGNELQWLPADFLAQQLLSTESDATTLVVLQRLAQLPDALEAVAAAGQQQPWQGQRASTIKLVLQQLYNTIRPAPTLYSWSPPKPVSAISVAWAQQALSSLQQSATDLPAAVWVSWWLEQLMPEPSAEIFLAHCLAEAGGQQQLGWARLSPAGASALAPLLLAWLAQVQPVAWLAQTRQTWSSYSHLAPLGQQVAAAIQATWPAAALVELWLLEESDQPSVQTLLTALAQAAPDGVRQILMAAEPSTLPALLNYSLAGRPTGPSAALELCLKVAGQHELTDYVELESWYNSLVQELAQELTPAQYSLYWQQQLLPPPRAEQLLTMVQVTPKADWPQLFQRCPVSLLQAYLPVLLASADVDEQQIKALLEALSSPTRFNISTLELRNELLAQLSHERQVQWWLEDVKAAIPAWEVIAHALADEQHSQWLAIAQKATRERLTQVLGLLPVASRQLVGVVADLLCHKRMFSGQNATARVPLLVQFAEIITQRWGQEPGLVLPWLSSLLQQCQAPSSSWTYSRYAEVENRGQARIKDLMQERVAPHLSALQQLECWVSGFISAHPAISNPELVAFVVRAMPTAAITRVATAYKLPEVLVKTWQALGHLKTVGFDKQFQALKPLLTEAAHFPGLLQEADAHLDPHLTPAQRALLWLFGYPGEAPTEGSYWTIAERMQGVIQLPSLGRELASIPWLAPTADELDEWLKEQYWEEHDQTLAEDTFKLVRSYHALAVVELPRWEELESELLLRCAGVVKVRLWMTLPADSQQRTFNYYSFRRGYSRLRTAEQREFLRQGQRYLLGAEKTEQEFKSVLHLRRRILHRQHNGVSVYRVSLAHCYCPQDGYLEVELAEKTHTLPFAYPQAQQEWNSRFIREPWAACKVMAHVDDLSGELLKIQGLEAALNQYPTDHEARATYHFQRERKVHGTTDNPLGYWEDERLHDELSSYLAELTDGTPFATVMLTEKLANRSASPVIVRPKLEAEVPSPAAVRSRGDDDDDDEVLLGLAMRPRQMVLRHSLVQDDVIFIWSPQFANSNRATYVFRAPARHYEQALERLTDLLENVSGIRSALLAPGLACHRLRCHLGYVRTIRGQRGKEQAFQAWRKRMDETLAAGPGRQHPYDADSNFIPLELHSPPAPAAAAVIPPSSALTTPPPAALPTEVKPLLAGLQLSSQQITAQRNQAQRMLQQLQRFNTLFLAGYPS